MDRVKLSEALTVRCGGFTTTEVAHAFGVSARKAWQVMRALEVAGVLEGYARKVSSGDDVERGLDGKPSKPGCVIQWFAKTNTEDEGRTPESDAAADKIIAAFQK